MEDGIDIASARYSIYAFTNILFPSVVDLNIYQPTSPDDFDKFRDIVINGLDFILHNFDKVEFYVKEFEKYMMKNFKNIYTLFPSNLKIRFFNIYKNLIESPNISTELKKKIMRIK